MQDALWVNDLSPGHNSRMTRHDQGNASSFQAIVDTPGLGYQVVIAQGPDNSIQL